VVHRVHLRTLPHQVAHHVRAVVEGRPLQAVEALVVRLVQQGGVRFQKLLQVKAGFMLYISGGCYTLVSGGLGVRCRCPAWKSPVLACKCCKIITSISYGSYLQDFHILDGT